MTEYDETNRGKIWKNEKKNPDDPECDTLPDFTGEFDIEGVKYFLDAWKRKPEANPKAPALKLKVKRKDKQPIKAGEPPRHPPGNAYAASTGRPDPISSGRFDDMKDDIPF